MSLKRVWLMCAVAPLALGVAFADEFHSTPQPSNSPAPAAFRTDEHAPDLTALRYYAHQHEQSRVAAEIRRIKADYPGWNPPDDLYDEKPKVDEQPLWDLYKKGDWAGIEKKIAELKTSHPDWTPSRDFLDKSSHARVAAAVVDASNAKDWAEVTKLATSQDGMVNCTELDLAWRIAEGLAHGADQGKAFDVYKFLLTSCKFDKERLATAQKAFEVLTDPDKIEAVIALGHKTPTGANEFADLRWSNMRATLGDYAAGKASVTADPVRLATFEAAARADKNGKDQLLLGWYFRKVRDHQSALEWMTLAYASDPNVHSAEGLALAQREAFKFSDAEATSYEWREKENRFRKMYIDIVSTSITAHGHDADIERKQSEKSTAEQAPVTAELTGSKGDVYGQALDRPVVYCGPQRPLTQAELERLMRFKTEVEIDKSALGAQAMGWRLVEANLTRDAALWFTRSMLWAPNEPAAVGLAVTAQKLNRVDAFRAILAKYGAAYPQLAMFKGNVRTSCVDGIMTAGVYGPGGPDPFRAVLGGPKKDGVAVVGDIVAVQAPAAAVDPGMLAPSDIPYQ